MLRKVKARIKGFTLIELLVVMAIIAFLMLASLAGLTYGLKKARDTSRQRAVATIQTALLSYYNDNLQFPSYTQITALGGTCTSIGGSIYRCDVTPLVGLNATGDGFASNRTSSPLYKYFEEGFRSPIAITAGKDLDRAMGYYVNSDATQYAICTLTELDTSGNVTPHSSVTADGDTWGCYCLGSLAEDVACNGLEDPTGVQD